MTRPLLTTLLATVIWALPFTFASARSLKSALTTLARQEGFQLEGTDQLGHERANQADGEVTEQLEILLKDYNYLLTSGNGGKLQSVKITSPKQIGPKPTSKGYIQTSRAGSHHQVDAELIGPSGDRVPVTLLVDTGATMVVLPESMIESLGFRKEELSDGISQTASDTIHVKVGMLRSVTVGNVSAEQIHVSFLPDSRLNGTKLLGMSFLNHFRFSLDDEANELMLLKK
jgi:aspartyl protease family protein